MNAYILWGRLHMKLFTSVVPISRQICELTCLDQTTWTAWQVCIVAYSCKANLLHSQVLQEFLCVGHACQDSINAGWRAISKRAIMTLCRRKKGVRFRRFASHLRYSTPYYPDFSLLLVFINHLMSSFCVRFKLWSWSDSVTASLMVLGMVFLGCVWWSKGVAQCE